MSTERSSDRPGDCGPRVHFELWKYRTAKRSVDATRGNYEFWDKLRRGAAEGYELGGLFCRPITEIVASYTLGGGLQAHLNADPPAQAESEDVPPEPDEAVEYTNGLLNDFLTHYHHFLLAREIDKLALGDQFVIVNPDGSLSAASPETVEVQYDRLDYRRPVSYIIRTRTDTAEITDEYRLDGRTQRVKWLSDQPDLGRKAGDEDVLGEWANLIGRLPVIHLPNDRSLNEQYGRPIYEALLHLFSRYDDLLTKALDGAELMGNPIPVFEGLENIDETIRANQTQEDQTYNDLDGNEEDRELIRFDTRGVIFLGKGGAFKFAAPPVGFTQDIRDMLKLLFLLVMDFSRIPEYLWGSPSHPVRPAPKHKARRLFSLSSRAGHNSKASGPQNASACKPMAGCWNSSKSSWPIAA